VSQSDGRCTYNVSQSDGRCSRHIGMCQVYIHTQIKLIEDVYSNIVLWNVITKCIPYKPKGESKMVLCASLLNST